MKNSFRKPLIAVAWLAILPGLSMGDQALPAGAGFSSGSYTYIEEGDKALKTFSIDHDREFRIPLIKKAIKAAGGELLLYGSPPAFMKDSNDMLQGGKLLPEFRDSWALYYTKFIKAYEAEGMPIWGITIQNEPMAVQRWESSIYTAEEERDFLRDHLGPAHSV
jgi:glucosylceramidase